MQKIKLNKSKTYLLPLLSEVVDLDLRFYKHIKNCYIFDDLNKYEDCIFILHDFNFKNPEFTAYEHKLIKNPHFMELVDVDNFVIYIFKFPKEYIKEYNFYKEGKYSQFGTDAKELILEFYTKVYKNNPNAVNFLLTTKQILFRNKILKRKLEKKLNVKLDDNAELSDIINIEDETLALSKEKKVKKENNNIVF